MNISVLVDSLMIYAQENLLLDDLDLIYARNRIIQLLNLSDYAEYEISADMVEGVQNPYQYLEQISAYAVSTGVIGEEERGELETAIMTILIKRPSEIADTFTELLEHGKYAKAFLWLSEYNQKSGYIKFSNILKHWEAKGTKGKIEVYIAKKTPEPRLGNYPACNLCPEIEGLGKYRLCRRVPIELDGASYFWQFEENPYVSGLGYAVSLDHATVSVNEDALNRMFDFVTLAPNYFIAMEETSSHGFFLGAVKQLPIHRAPELQKLKSSEYPYISISELDWYTNVLRVACTNREKLIEFILKLNDSFRSQNEGNRLSISLRKTDKYVLELFFENENLRVSEKNTSLFEARPDFLSRMGIVTLPASLNEEMAQMDAYLTKEVKFSESSLPENMQKHKGTIAKILKEIGSTKISSVEAQIDIKEEINNITESALCEMRVFEKSDQGAEEFNNFLQTQSIKPH